MAVPMAIVAAFWLAYQYWRLLWGDAAIWNSSPRGAVDLRTFQERSNGERAVIFLLIFSCYASGATIGNGQLGNHVLVALLAAVLVLTRARATLATDLFG